MRLFSYRNIGETVDQGAEFSLNHRTGSPFSWFVNYSYQKDPEFTFTGLTGAALAAQIASQNKPPKSRWNVGMAYDPGRWFVNANVNHQDDAYWADVLDVIGVTEAFTNVNASVGMRLMDERMTISVIGSNLTDEKVQQHIFGDIITQKITGQISLRF